MVGTAEVLGVAGGVGCPELTVWAMLSNRLHAPCLTLPVLTAREVGEDVTTTPSREVGHSRCPGGPASSGPLCTKFHWDYFPLGEERLCILGSCKTWMHC